MTLRRPRTAALTVVAMGAAVISGCGTGANDQTPDLGATDAPTMGSTAAPPSMSDLPACGPLPRTTTQEKLSVDLRFPSGFTQAGTRGTATVRNDGPSPVTVAASQTVLAQAIADDRVISTSAVTAEAAARVSVPAGGRVELPAVAAIFTCERSADGQLSLKQQLPAGDYAFVVALPVGDDQVVSAPVMLHVAGE